MQRAARILKYLGLALAGVVILTGAVVYGVSTYRTQRSFALASREINVPTDSTTVAEGRRLALIRGCLGCHGERAQGDTFIDDWKLARVISPDLTASMRRYTDKELEGIIRQGVRPDGRSVVVMPSGMFAPLTDRDLGAIIAYLRQLPPQQGPEPEVRLGPLARVAFTLGEFVPAATEVTEATELSRTYPAAGQPHHLGAYLARTSCTECHGLDLRGDKSGRPPDLSIAAAYPLDSFAHFMRTGKALGNRELPLMSEMSRRRFNSFTDEEIQALHAYFVARAK